ncbi:Sir2 family NAD-dependent protein deacetylase [Nocardia testacea]|uniref:Sir2 family NAD-dependent protein deacetylase n=1 Tax=Nocardia testacea TaxID=248551 RepID=UPI0033D676CC
MPETALITPPQQDSWSATLDDLVDLIGDRPTVVLTGAGISTDSGIPDYRGPDTPPRTPMTYQQFVGDPVFRQRYWARNHVGWRYMDAARPNAGHRALAELERAGMVTGVITQNVDLLHTKAGSRRVIDLHGSYAQVRCLGCGARISRMALAEQLEQANPGFATASVTGLEVAPDADAVVEDTSGFRMVDCSRCGGMWKPDIVYFGESVPPERVAAAYELVDTAEVIVAAGSSLTVLSGRRFVHRVARNGGTVVIVNRGPTRSDGLADRRLDAGCSPVLSGLAQRYRTRGARPADAPAGAA